MADQPLYKSTAQELYAQQEQQVVGLSIEALRGSLENHIAAAEQQVEERFESVSAALGSSFDAVLKNADTFAPELIGEEESTNDTARRLKAVQKAWEKMSNNQEAEASSDITIKGALETVITNLENNSTTRTALVEAYTGKTKEELYAEQDKRLEHSHYGFMGAQMRQVYAEITKLEGVQGVELPAKAGGREKAQLLLNSDKVSEDTKKQIRFLLSQRRTVIAQFAEGTEGGNKYLAKALERFDNDFGFTRENTAPFTAQEQAAPVGSVAPAAETNDLGDALTPPNGEVTHLNAKEVTSPAIQPGMLHDLVKLEEKHLEGNGRIGRLRKYASTMIDVAIEKNLYIKPEALRGALRIFFGREDALTKTGAYYPEINRVPALGYVDVPNYASAQVREKHPGGSRGATMEILYDLEPQFIAECYTDALEVIQTNPSPNNTLREIGIRMLEKAYQIDNSAFPESSRSLLMQDINKGKYEHILSNFRYN